MSDKTELKKSLLNAMNNLTKGNAHTDALVVMASYLEATGKEKEASKYMLLLNAIKRVHKYIGHMPYALLEARNQARDEILAEMSPEDRKDFSAAL